ncbi:TetR/AcrR family transcriptional regulator [Bradyrhizobium sp.]|uniref:TetR/AcrR family transcriptional regulator n=1 Tax=Bradyrhizobium sp. TaxID=376 RepID=UPI001D641BF2|nr:TetR/AcrR family transcriptional regulator [Bradyrhizobium sp.]MBI5319313.1 TetR/AcrR family transcriptional regulator [Bradyrhizobium sp.]
MTRSYTLKRRAEQQAETRLRIVEAAVELHGQFGPALTTLSMVAERAGVQRHTLYAHFPDERSLFLACSGLALERDPLPDASGWRAIADRRERLRTALAALYAWYGRNAGLLGCVLRDAEFHPLTREISELRFGPFMAACDEALGAKLNARQRAMLRLALSFFTWRTLVNDGDLKSAAAAKAMAHAIEGAIEA